MAEKPRRQAKARRKSARPGDKNATLPSDKDIIDFINRQPGKVGKREIARAFDIKGSARIALKDQLRRLRRDGVLTARGKRLSDASRLPPVLVVDITGIDSDGELVAAPADPDPAAGSARILVHPQSTPRRRGSAGQTLSPGQRALVRVTRIDDTDYDYEARIIKALPSSQTLHRLGIVEATGGGDIIIAPVDRRERNALRVARAEAGAVRKGELVKVSPLPGGSSGMRRARIVERYGSGGDQRNISRIAIHQYGLADEFAPEVIAEANQVRKFTASGRIDLRHVPFITIDPADARDHDDAVWAEVGDDGSFRLIVAIADVSWYVRPAGAIDTEARARANSVYFPDRVVAMLPEKLSTDLCSLRAGKQRPVLVCDMRFNRNGRKSAHKFYRAVMRSRASLTYEQAQAAIDGHPDDISEPLLKTVLEPLWQAYRVLARARARRAPLELDVPERKLILDAHGLIERVVTPARLDAHRLIEEMMIQANVCAAEQLEKLAQPLIYRVHDAPAREKIVALNDFLKSLDLPTIGKSTVKPSDFNKILKLAAKRDFVHVVNEVVLRSQSQAVYDVQNRGHFGLNLARYAHFTSPIRRYADLIVHRALVSALKLGEGGLSDDDVRRMPATAEHISAAERVAMQAERDTADRLMAAHLKSRVGAVFCGRISGIARAGIFITLDDTGADGFVPVSTIGDDYFIHDEARHALIGETTGATYQLADRVEVRLVEAAPVSGGLRFEMLSPGKPGKPARRHRRPRPARRR